MSQTELATYSRPPRSLEEFRPKTFNVVDLAVALIGGAAVALWPMALPICVGALALFVSWRFFGEARTLLVALAGSTVVPLPSFVPLGVSLGRGTLLWSDVVVGLCAVVVTGRVLARRFDSQRSPLPQQRLWLSAMILIAIWACMGAARGVVLNDFIRDVRPLIYGVVAACTVAEYATAGQAMVRFICRVGGAVVLWGGAASVAASVLGTTWLQGKFDDSSLYVNGHAMYTSAASRILLPCSYLAMAVIAIIFSGWAVASRPLWSRRSMGIVAFAATVSLFLTYQRVALVAPVIGCVAAVLLSPRLKRFALRAVMMSCIVGLLAAGAGTGLLGASPSQGQWTSWTSRVITGLNPALLGSESSGQWRVTEARAALESVAKTPLIGTGLGVRYRGRIAGEVFSGDDGLSYVHSSPIWLLLKFGIPVALIVMALVVSLFVRVRRAARSGDEHADLALALASGLAATLGASLVMAVPFSVPGSVTCGALVGAIFVCLQQSRRSTGADERPRQANRRLQDARR